MQFQLLLFSDWFRLFHVSLLQLWPTLSDSISFAYFNWVLTFFSNCARPGTNTALSGVDLGNPARLFLLHLRAYWRLVSLLALAVVNMSIVQRIE